MTQAWTLAREIAADTGAVLTRAQAHLAGLDDRQISRACAPGGRWQRVLPGVYATFTGPLLTLHVLLAAQLYCGPLAQITGVTALAWYGCVYVPTDPRVHVLVPADVRSRAVSMLRLHRTNHLPPARMVRSVRLSPPDRAAIVAARHLRSVRDARAMLSEVVQRRMTTVDRLRLTLEDGSMRGSALPRRILDELDVGVRSAPEAELLALLRRRPSLLRGGRWNYRIDLDGRVVVADLCWPWARVIVEIDSVSHHGLGDGPEYTSRRRAALTAAGWTVLSISPRRIRQQPEAVLDEIARVLRLSAR